MAKSEFRTALQAAIQREHSSGGIGCGGALGEEDHLCAEAGAKAVSS